MNISKKLKRLRESRGMTQKEAASALRIACSSYRLYETRDNKLPPADVLARICQLFGVSADFLLDLSAEESAQPVSVPEELRADASAVMRAAAALCELEGSRPYDRPALIVYRQIIQQLAQLVEASDAKHAELLAQFPAYREEDRPGRLPEDLREKLLAQTVNGSVDEDLRQLARAGASYSEEIEKLVTAATLNVSALIRSSLGQDLGAAPSALHVPAIKK